MHHPLTLNGYSNFINAVKRQRNLGLPGHLTNKSAVTWYSFCSKTNDWFNKGIQTYNSSFSESNLLLLNKNNNVNTYMHVPVQRQRVMHTENSGFASPTLGQHISTLRGYRILFSIRNPYINRFTNHFSIHS
jgi:hypothetical protein